MSEYKDVDEALDDETSLEDSEEQQQQQQQQHFEEKPEIDIERLEENEDHLEDNPETEVEHLEESIHVTSESIAAAVVEPTTAPNAVTSQLTINNHRLEGEKVKPKISDNKAAPPTASDMTNGYLFFRMLTG